MWEEPKRLGRRRDLGEIFDPLGECWQVLLRCWRQLLVDRRVVVDGLSASDLGFLDSGLLLLFGLGWQDGLVGEAGGWRGDVRADHVVDERGGDETKEPCEAVEVRSAVGNNDGWLNGSDESGHDASNRNKEREPSTPVPPSMIPVLVTLAVQSTNVELLLANDIVIGTDYSGFQKRSSWATRQIAMEKGGITLDSLGITIKCKKIYQ